MSRILIVEDDAPLAQLMSGVLSVDGHTIDVCGDGSVAAARLADSPVDLLLLDVNIPGQDGIEVCRAVRAAETAGHRTTIVMITGRHDTASKLLAFSVGADDYLVKPVDVRELRSRVARWIDSRTEQATLVMQRRREAIDQIVTAICHELNNPLAAALMGVELVLHHGSPTPQDRATLDVARQELLRMTEAMAALTAVEDRTVPYLGSRHMIDVRPSSPSNS